MKQDERDKAFQAYLASDGQLSNVALAEAVGVNPMTVGRWKSEFKWEKQLKERNKARRSADKKKSSTNEKKGLSKSLEKEMAKNFYISAGGEISNAALAKAVDVNPVTIAKWKKAENWEADLHSAKSIFPDNDHEHEHTIEYQEGDYEEVELPLALDSLDELLSPDQITLMNQKIQEHLNREHLSAEELAHLAEAKSDLLDSVQSCLNIIQDLRNFAFWGED